jgi:hypothetical protein
MSHLLTLPTGLRIGWRIGQKNQPNSDDDQECDRYGESRSEHFVVPSGVGAVPPP